MTTGCDEGGGDDSGPRKKRKGFAKPISELCQIQCVSKGHCTGKLLASFRSPQSHIGRAPHIFSDSHKTSLDGAQPNSYVLHLVVVSSLSSSDGCRGACQIVYLFCNQQTTSRTTRPRRHSTSFPRFLCDDFCIEQPDSKISNPLPDTLAGLFWRSESASRTVDTTPPTRELRDIMAQPSAHPHLTPQFCFSSGALRGEFTAPRLDDLWCGLC